MPGAGLNGDDYFHLGPLSKKHPGFSKIKEVNIEPQSIKCHGEPGDVFGKESLANPF